MAKKIDITGQRFGRLTVLSEHPKRYRTSVQWVCRCDCGSETIVVGNKLRNGHTKSCGCLQKERTSKAKKTHGRTREPLHVLWVGMRSRCNNENHTSYEDYGKRGITVCDEWSDYENFRKWALQNGYKKGLEIDRIDNDKGYSPENCRWVTRKANMRNTRHNVKVNGNYLTDFFKGVSERHNLSRTAVVSRYYRLKEKGIEPTEENIINYLNI